MIIERQIAEDKIPLLAANLLHTFTIVTGLLLPLMVRERVSQLEELHCPVEDMSNLSRHLGTVIVFRICGFVDNVRGQPKQGHLLHCQILRIVGWIIVVVGSPGIFLHLPVDLDKADNLERQHKMGQREEQVGNELLQL